MGKFCRMYDRWGTLYARLKVWISSPCQSCVPWRQSVHCFIHRFALWTKVLPDKLLMCLNRVVKIVNFVKTSALSTRLFKVCEDLGSDHNCLLYHTEVCLLSRGNTTKRLFEMRNGLLLFLHQKDHDFQNNLEDEEFIARLAYLSDIFEAFNHLNLSFQGQNCTVVDLFQN